ncbi:hypothetical protein HNQ59_000005 [Chitinivorax tropicus]|uniref:Uncharacterized protein n=2 Tax=Chitinivorax tropicus TaxID=714531 RepID=A0A840MKT5_9PROT|nr:hypothetical protein [Chitinivorax tropicus]
MKQAADDKTMELPGMPVPKRRGRPPIGTRAMTAAERKRRSRQLNGIGSSVDLSRQTARQLRDFANDNNLTIDSAIQMLIVAFEHIELSNAKRAGDLVAAYAKSPEETVGYMRTIPFQFGR